MKLCVVLGIVSAALAGCAGLGSGTGHNGAEMVSQKQDRVTLRQVDPPAADRLLLAFVVAVTNGSTVNETFGPTNVSAMASGQPVRIYTAPELQARIQKQADFARYVATTRAEMIAQPLE